MGRQQFAPTDCCSQAGRERVGAGQHEIDVDATGILLRLDLAGQFGRRRLGEGDLRDEIGLGLAVGLDRLLRQREIAGDVDDVEGYGRIRQSEPLSARGPWTEGQPQCRADEMPASRIIVHRFLP